MKKIKKITIKVNGKIMSFKEPLKILDLLKKLKVPLNKVAVELNFQIIDKKKINLIKIKNKDKIEIVHFIGGG